MSAPISPAGLWAITSYYNPAGYRRRLANYHLFRSRLAVPLLAVELAFGSDFELREPDADRLVQLRGRDVMWQKERLLNIALQHLPADCDKVIWLDCDLVYTHDDWPDELARLLDTHALVHGLRRVLHLSAAASAAPRIDGAAQGEVTSFVTALAAGAAVLEDLACIPARDAEATTRGFAWAARRELIDSIGFYDSCIVGGGDSAFLCAACGRFDLEIRSHLLNARRAEHYLDWARPAFAAIAGWLGFLDVDVLHLWHGDLVHRGNPHRHRRLAESDFDPFADIALAETGCWEWSSDKPDMHRWIGQFFAERREDG